MSERILTTEEVERIGVDRYATPCETVALKASHELLRAERDRLLAERERLVKLRDAASNLAWATETEIRGGRRTRSFITQHRAKCEHWIRTVRELLAAFDAQERT